MDNFKVIVNGKNILISQREISEGNHADKMLNGQGKRKVQMFQQKIDGEIGKGEREETI